jgi:DNA-binding response OmpR family regulator
MNPAKILIIDDEPLILKSTAMILKYHHFEVLTSLDSTKGIKMAQTANPDLILLDIMMPGMNGWEVLHILSEDPETKTIPVLIFTAKECSEEENELHSHLVCDIISKPFNPELMVELINKHIQSNVK